MKKKIVFPSGGTGTLFVNRKGDRFKIESDMGWTFISPRFRNKRSLTNTLTLFMDCDFLNMVRYEADTILDVLQMIPKFSEICLNALENIGELKMPFGRYKKEGKKINEVPASYLLWYKRGVDSGEVERPNEIVMAYISKNEERLRKDAAREPTDDSLPSMW